MSAVLKTDNANELVSYNPASGEEVGRVAVDSPENVRTVVKRSREVFHKWKTTTFAERKALVMQAREVILADIDGIAKLISAESGKPFGEAIAMEIAPVLDLMQWIARGAGKILKPKRVGIGLYGLLGRSSKIIYKPYGVVAIIPAWNYPFSIPLGEAVMAVMAGNTVVMKPSELTPLVGAKIGEIFREAVRTTNFSLSAGKDSANLSLLDDLVQIVHGAGETGAALVDAAPDKLMFTGSVATGKKIAKAAAENLMSTVLELGGKDPMIVFEDANLELAAGAAVWGAFCNAGQSCSSVERLYVQESVADELTQLIVEKTKQLKQGRGDAEDISIGPMSSERQLKIVEDHVQAFREGGAKIETGGNMLVPPPVSGGLPQAMVDNKSPQSEPPGFANPPLTSGGSNRSLFFPPTVITGATNDMRPMREETFGPTLPIATFNTEEEAIALANDSEFGLTASVWTKDYARGRRVAAQIDAGSVCINEVLYTHGIGQTPWGGFKNSGRGRTHGIEGLMELVQPQHIHTNRIALLPNAWWMPYSPTSVETFRQMARKFASGSLLKTATLVPQLLKRIRELR